MQPAPPREPPDSVTAEDERMIRISTFSLTPARTVQVLSHFLCRPCSACGMTSRDIMSGLLWTAPAYQPGEWEIHTWQACPPSVLFHLSPGILKKPKVQPSHAERFWPRPFHPFSPMREAGVRKEELPKDSLVSATSVA